MTRPDAGLRAKCEAKTRLSFSDVKAYPSTASAASVQ